MSLSDAARQITLVDATARRTVVKSRLPVRMEPRRPAVTQSPVAVSDLAGDGDDMDAVIMDFRLDGLRPRTDADPTDPETASALKVQVADGDKTKDYSVLSPAGDPVTVPRVVNRQIMLVRGVDYVGLANTSSFEDVNEPNWKVTAPSEIDATQRGRLQKLD